MRRKDLGTIQTSPLFKRINDSIGEQVLHRRCRMTKCSGHYRTDSSRIVQNWKRTKEGFFRKYFTHTVGYPINDPIFYKDVTPFQGFPISTYIYPSEGSTLASGSFPVAEKWKECR